MHRLSGITPPAPVGPASSPAALRAFRPDEDTNPGFGWVVKGDRTPSGWIDALEKQLAIIRLELSIPDCDDVFWKREYMAAEAALDTMKQALGPIDEAICAYQRTKEQIIAGIGVRLRETMPGTNLPEFLIRDDPQGYLRW